METARLAASARIIFPACFTLLSPPFGYSFASLPKDQWFKPEKIYNVICIGDDSGSSESLPQPNNAAYKPVVINISNDAGPSHRRMKAKKKKKKEHTSHAPTTKSIKPKKAEHKTYITRATSTIYF